MNQNRDPHIEIKTTYLSGKKVDKIIEKETVIGVVNTEKISKPGKKKLDEAGIAWAENVPEKEVLEYEDREEG
jgi:hypothetical protein